MDRGDTMKRISTDEYEALERASDGEVKIYRLRPVLARFMIDEAGNPIPHDMAMKQLGAMPFEEFMTDVFAAFFKTMQDLAVPNVNGNSSQSLSDQAPVFESPVGSVS